MAKVLDLNSIKISVLELVFADDEHTTLHITAPTEGLINEMESWVKSGMEKLTSGGDEGVEMTYDLVGRLLSCNREGITVTPADLRGKYKVDLWTLIPIINAYTEFISDIKNEKN